MPRVGYIAIVGRPNTGKSTLLNTLLGARVSAISHRPQTTQRNIRGIYTDEEQAIQMIFLDTPGIHQESREQFGTQKSHEIHDRINQEAISGISEADVIIRLLDPTRPVGSEDRYIDEQLSMAKCPIIRVETKQDLPRGHHHPRVDFRIDTTNRAGLDELIHHLSTLLPEGPYLYDPEYYTDQPMDLRISEVIRESLFLELGEEIPYACWVEIAEIEYEPLHDGSGDRMKIQAYINTESDSQKTIIIGKNGSKIASIGSRSRLILEEIFGHRVFLALRVKVVKNWRKNKKVLDRIFPKK